MKAALTGNITTVNCAPVDTGGACPFSIDLYFRLPEEQFVTSAFVRFQRDGSDAGVDRLYKVKEIRNGQGDARDASVSIDAQVPPNLVGTGALFTFSVRLVTGIGEQSDESTLTLTVTNIQTPKTDTTKDKDGGS